MVTRAVVGKEERNKRFIRSFHEYVWGTCKKLRIPLRIAYKIESTRFQDSYSHEAEVSRFLAETNGQLFVDVGANIGRYTILLASRYLRVISVEPEPNNMFALKGNVQEAGLSNVSFIQCAVSDMNHTVNLYIGPHSGGHTIISPYKQSINVTARTLASLLSNQKSIDLVKVDVEGAEWKVLAGAAAIMESIRSWVVELHDLTRKKELEKWFSSHGYITQWLDEKHIYARQRGGIRTEGFGFSPGTL